MTKSRLIKVFAERTCTGGMYQFLAKVQVWIVDETGVSDSEALEIAREMCHMPNDFEMGVWKDFTDQCQSRLTEPTE